MNDKLIGRDISDKVLYLGVSRRSKGGMTSVILSYQRYIESMRFVSTWNLGGKLKKAAYMAQALIRTASLLAFRRNIRLIHIHGAANASFARATIFIRLARATGRKVILHEHAADFEEFYDKSADRRAITDTINSCDCLIALSESWRRYFESIGVEPGKIQVLNNIVAPAPQDYRRRNASDGPLELLYLGEVSRRKGCFDLLEAIAARRSGFEGRLHLRVGGNQVDGDIAAYISEHGLQNIVSYEGWVSGRKKEDCLRGCDVYILPSYNEGLPIAILESMAYGHPVISTPAGGIPEVIKDGVNGRLVTAGDTAAIADAVMGYIENRALVKEHGDCARRDVEPFLPEQVMRSLRNIYSKLGVTGGHGAAEKQ